MAIYLRNAFHQKLRAIGFVWLRVVLLVAVTAVSIRAQAPGQGPGGPEIIRSYKAKY